MATTEATRTERRRQRTHQLLLAAGFEIVGERGVHGWPISDIADRADVALGSFYNHFADRDDFIEELIATYIVAAQDEMLANVRTDDDDFAKRAAIQYRNLVNYAIDAPDYRAFIVSLGAINHARPQQLTDRYLARLTRVRDAGEISCVDLELMLAAEQGLVLSVFRHINHLESIAPGSIDRLALVRETVRISLAIAGVDPQRMAEIDNDLLSETLDSHARTPTTVG